MSLRRALILTIATLSGVVAVIGGTTDLRIDATTNCGSALLPADDCFLVRAVIEDAPVHAVKQGDLLLVHPGARAAEQAAVVARVEQAKAAYLRWGRDTLGWAIYLFRTRHPA